MSGINKIILVGHVDKEPELTYSSDCKPRLIFSLVTIENIRKGTGFIQLKEWHNIVMLNLLAETAYENLRSGAHLYIDGKARTRSFIDRDERKFYVTEIFAESYTLLQVTIPDQSAYESQTKHK